VRREIERIEYFDSLVEGEIKRDYLASAHL
jgi:hypothetical protein